MKSIKDSRRSGTYMNYAVGFFDLLGQSDELKTIQGFVLSKGAISEKQLSETMGRLKRDIRDHRAVFEGFFSKMEEADPRLVINPIKYSWWSDAVTVWTSVAGDGEGVIPFGLGHMVYASAISSMFLLDRGIPLRGGIDVDIGDEEWPDEIYGPAFLSAYELEKQAGWPRVILGNSAKEFLGNLVPNARWQATFLTRWKGLLDEADGVTYVDFAGKTFRDLQCDQGQFEDMKARFQRGRRFAEARLDYFGGRNEAKVASKYWQLSRYLESRAPLWA